MTLSSLKKISDLYLTEASRFNGIGLSMIRTIMAKAPENAINLALGELAYPLPAILRDKAIDILGKETPRYTPNAGLPELREAIATYTGTGISPERVCVCNGAEEAVFLATMSILEPGDKVAIPDPDYTAYPAIVKLLGGESVRLPHEKDFVSVDWDLWESILSKNVRILILSNPCNPSGVFFSSDDINRLITICERHRIAIIADEIYRDLCFENYVPSFAGRSDIVFVVNGLSKSRCMSGWRLGWVVSPSNLASTLVKAKQYISTCSNWLSQKIGAFALSDGKVSGDEVLSSLQRSRDVATSYLKSNLPDGYLHYTSATPYIMLRCEGSAIAKAEEMAQQGVILVPGAAFGDVSEHWLRINYAVEIAQLQEALPVIIRGIHTN